MLERTSKITHNARVTLEMEEVKPMIGDTNGNESSSTSAPGKNPHAVAMGRLGGKRGGKARAEKLGAERRKEIARKAALARWKKAREE